MVTREDIESFLDRLTAEADGASYSEVEPGLGSFGRPGDSIWTSWCTTRRLSSSFG